MHSLIEMDNILYWKSFQIKICLCAKHLSDSNIYGVLTMCLFCILLNLQIIPSYYLHITHEKLENRWTPARGTELVTHVHKSNPSPAHSEVQVQDIHLLAESSQAAHGKLLFVFQEIQYSHSWGSRSWSSYTGTTTSLCCCTPGTPTRTWLLGVVGYDQEL